MTPGEISEPQRRPFTPDQKSGAQVQIRSSFNREGHGENATGAGRPHVVGAFAGYVDETTSINDVGIDPSDHGPVSMIEAAEAAPDIRFPSPDPLFAGCPSLFLQTACSESKLGPAAALVAQEETGIILTISTQVTDRIKGLRRAVKDCRATMTASAPDRAMSRAVLADANRYSGSNRASATVDGPNLDPGWVDAQRELGLPVALTDSPYVPTGERAALSSVLDEAQGLGDGVVAVLPLHLDWLKNDVAALIDAVNSAGVPVALVLEHSDDPLGVKSAVAGLVTFLQHTEVKTALLRSDISAIGAAAFGAAFGAIGTTTGLRHLYPIKESDGGFYGGARVGAYVPSSMAYRALETLNTAIALDPDHQDRWVCNCDHCYDRPLSRIYDEVAAYQHSLAAIAKLGEYVLSGKTPLHRQHAWLGRCNQAQVTNLEIADDTGLTNWGPPKFQDAWHKLKPSLPTLP